MKHPIFAFAILLSCILNITPNLYSAGLSKTAGTAIMAPMAATIVNGTLDISNRFVDVTFDEGVWSNSITTTPVIPGDFNLNFDDNGGGLTSVSIKSARQADNTDEALASPLTGGETVIRLFFNLNGTPSGVETIEVTPSTGVTIFISGGTPVPVTETTGDLTFNEAPKITNTDTQFEVCNNNSPGITVIADLVGTNFTWTAMTPTPAIISGFTNNGTGASIDENLMNSGTVTGEVRYKVTPENGGVLGNPVTFVVKVFPVPNVTPDPINQEICNNDVALIDLDGDVFNTTYSWTVSADPEINNAIDGGSDSRILQVLENTGPATAQAIYTITPSANDCSGSPVVASVDVLPAFFARVLSQKDTICNETPTTTFDVELEGTGPWSITYVDGNTTFNEVANSSPFTVTVFPGSANTTYTIQSVIDQSTGCILLLNSSEREFTVFRIKEILAELVTGNEIVCESTQNLEIEIDFQGLGPWQLQYLDNGTSESSTFTSASSGIEVSPQLGINTYELLSVTDLHPRALACATSVNGSIVVEKIPFPTGTLAFNDGESTKDVCLNEEISLSVELTGQGPWRITYSDGVENITVDNITSSPYNFTYNVERSGTIVLSLLSVNTSNPTCPGTVSGIATAVVKPVPTGIGSVSGDPEVCANEDDVTYTVSNIIGADEYTWSLPTGVQPIDGNLTTSTTSINLNFTNGAESGEIRVVGSNQCGSGPATTPFNVEVLNVPVLEDPINGSELVCAGESAVAYSIPDQGEGVSYIWTLPNGANSGGFSGEIITNKNEILVNYTINASNSAIKVSASNECIDRSDPVSKDITVKQIPPKPNSISGPDELCAESGGIEFTSDNIPDVDGYAWQLPQSFTPENAQFDSESGLYLTTGPTIRVRSGATSGLLNVKAAGVNECGIGDLSLAYNIDVNSVPQFFIDIDPSKNEAFTGEVIYFNAVVSNNNQEEISEWNWQFGDGNSGNGVSTQHIYGRGGTFLVELEGTNVIGCTGSSSIEILITEDFPIRIMNIITPNGDNRNDGLFIEGVETFPLNEVRLISRIGVEVFYAEDFVNNNWNDYNVNLEPGTYLCLFKIKGVDKTISQTITVIKN
jgi:hypothetical protein